MTGRIWFRLLCAMSLAGAVSACQPDGEFGALSGVGALGPEGPSPIRQAVAEVDPELVRAPELFTVSGVAKWNGLRTSRGVWVAHPRARSARKVRIINSRTGAAVDGMAYRARGRDDGDVVTLSSDAARALGVAKGESTPIALIGLRPKGTQSRVERARVETRAQGELATHISRMDDTALLRLVAAAMRGMGYATVFEDGPQGDQRPSIRAFVPPSEGVQLPSIRVVVRPRASEPAGPEDIKDVHDWLTGSGDLGVLVSVPGFAGASGAGSNSASTRIELVDLDALMNIWLTHYEQMSAPDKALLPLRPVYFVANGSSGPAQQP
ncbi:MAG: hypothetical protein AB8B85_00420 [Paracoccaceae bacterium]